MSVITRVETPLDRRRRASLRMQPLETGYRDPLDEQPPLTEAEARELCRMLWSQGFPVDYLERRYGVPRIGVAQ